MPLTPSKAAEAAATLPFADLADVGMFSAAKLLSIVTSASDEEIKQARRDCQMIAGLIAKGRNVDWGAPEADIKPVEGKLTGAKDWPSWQDRRAKRTRPSAPGFVREVIDGWRDYDVRARLLATLIYIRRNPHRMGALGMHLNSMLAVLDLALAALPKRSSGANGVATDRARQRPASASASRPPMSIR